jgi:benzoyl-CoA reductase subunit BamB
MGDKGVKAIAVRGTGDINIARPAEYMQLCNEVLSTSSSAMPTRSRE